MSGGVVQVTGELISTRRAGAYHHLTVVAPGVAELAHPGQFVALAVGGPTSANLLRRCFSIHRVKPSGTYGGTVDVVVSAVGAGTQWLTGLRAHDPVDVVGPLGRAFPLPSDPVPCVLVGGGYGSAPLFWLAETLRERGCHVEMVLGAASEDRLFGVVEGRRSADAVHVTTDDGTAGTRGWVSDVLGEVVDRTGAGVVYACGPMAMLRSVTEVATAHGRGRPGRRRGGDGLRHRGLHDLRPARPSAPTAAPGWCAPASRARSSGATGCAGTRSRAGSPEVPPTTRSARAATGGSLMVDMTTTLAGRRLPNPVMTASGLRGERASELNRFLDVSELGAFVTKTVMRDPRSGRPTPRMAETPSGHAQLDRAAGAGHRRLLRRRPAVAAPSTARGSWSPSPGTPPRSSARSSTGSSRAPPGRPS